MTAKGRSILLTAAAASLAIALLHVVTIAIGAPAYLYFGASGLAELAYQGSWAPAIITLGISVLFVGFALYALAGAGLVRGVPFVRAGLLAIGTVYTLRGLIVVLDLARLIGGGGYPIRQTLFSAVSLGLGLLYLAGARERPKER